MTEKDFLPFLIPEVLNAELFRQEQREVFMFNYDFYMTIAGVSENGKTIAEFSKELVDSVNMWKDLKDEDCPFEIKVVRARFKLFVNRLWEYARHYKLRSDDKLSLLAEKLRTELEQKLDRNREWLYFGRMI